MNKRDWSSSIVNVGATNGVDWSDWSVESATKDGYLASGWVYRAIRLISSNASTVDFRVYNRDGEHIENHPVDLLLSKPTPSYSAQSLRELVVSWLQLTGRAFLYQNIVNGKTVELWPISPDRLRPLRSTEPGVLIGGYEERTNSGSWRRSQQFTQDNVIYLRLSNPADPIDGISPLHAAAKQVDLDRYQLEWNASATANRAVVDGVITFKQEIHDRSLFEALRDRIKEVWSGKRNAREPMILGNDASYHRLGLTPAEMDFIESRKNNRDEILAIFGVPAVLVNNTDASTYNNYSASVRVFWESTIIPLLWNMASGLEVGLSEYLNDGEWIGPDLTTVEALNDHLTDKVEVAEKMFRIGVPLAEINRRLGLGLMDIEDDQQIVEPRAQWVRRETRATADDFIKQRDKIIEGEVNDKFSSVLSKQRSAVFESLDSESDYNHALIELRKDMLDAIQYAASTTAIAAAGQIVDVPRSFAGGEKRAEEYFADEVMNLLLAEEWINSDESNIHQTTANRISSIVAESMSSGETIQEIKERINDSGVFSPVRALRLARTVGGTGASFGQYAAGRMTGAQIKVWQSSNDDSTRDDHLDRHGEAVGMDELFSLRVGFVAPRFPLDPRVDPADRVNCRCAMTFE